MSPRFEPQGDDDGQGVEELYGTPQHETRRDATEQELYGEPQHDIPDDRRPTDFDPDLGHALNWFDYPRDSASRLRRELFPMER